MRHTCEHCATAYEIPNDKVAGRFLKVRCKACLLTMHVVGVEAQAHAPDAVWWCALAVPNGEVNHTAGEAARGPYRAAEVKDLVAQGLVHGRTRIWTHGMAGWERVCESAALAWVYSEVLNASAIVDGLDAFERCALLGDDAGYFPDPTLKSGIILLDDNAQRALRAMHETQQRLAFVESKPGLMLPTAAAIAGATAAIAGVVWTIAAPFL